ncbi:hypothetical protein halTADL_3334 [Halohasta litchfieldiae]|jgi:hypothetical protein|uniref:Uncharacterized protein n=1 Tax=Halohasta litchfieldiae TaxID=1073996 RepID=A0A1H6X9Q2_9EURY|nr:hypothetical protein [Halohasta litchfieldiae]ATW90036.1 hypothetical protein halTADL_3334 [Halohasta litchfieldiae]SEJ24836.1 hypothetical protein SAMN05444271_13522 [Halohasta litchfieldiae]
MDAQTYRNRIETAVLDADYEPISDESTGEFEPVWHKQTEDPTIGVTEVFVTVIDSEGTDEEILTETSEAFRRQLSEMTPSEPSTMENLFGYVVFAVSEPSEELIQFATEEYTVADRRTSVFPLLYDLENETLHRHPVPRLKGRGFYEKQKLDAESLFSL